MTDIEKNKLDRFFDIIFPLKRISWTKFEKIFGKEIYDSPSLPEILLQIEQNNIELIDTKKTFQKDELENSTIITMNVEEFSEIFDEIEKYDDGSLLVKYLKGDNIQKLAGDLKITKEEVARKIKKFARYINIRELQNLYLPIIQNYDISKTDFILNFHTDMILTRFLFLKCSCLSKEEKLSYRTVQKFFLPKLEGVPKKL